MNKLLLLATTLICLTTLQGYTAGTSTKGGQFNSPYSFKDSTIKDQVIADPKAGFKDLFESASASLNGINITQLNPKALSFVQDYMEDHSARLTKMKDWGKPYFDMISNILTQHGLPVELKYLAVIESDLKSSAVSWAGAVGPWQFMPATARLLGLKVSRSKDERTDFVKSTKAAARYLTELFGLYNDWLLVIAAYNGGPGNVNAAIRKSGSRNFWDLQNYLPAESRNHVKKFIATHYIMEGEGGVTTLTKSETENLALSGLSLSQVPDSNTSVLNVTGKYNSIAITQVLQMDLTEFNRLNPNFDKQLSANGSYEMKLPNDKMTLFQANKPQILEQSIRLMLSTVSR